MHTMADVKNYLTTLQPSLAGYFFYYCLPYRRSIVLRNLQKVFSAQLNDREIRKLAQCFYSHVVSSIKENFLMRLLGLNYVKKCVKVRGEEHTFALNNPQQKGILILTGHFGNWEFAPLGGIMQFCQYQGRFYFIRKALRLKWLERFLFKRYGRAGLGVIPKHLAAQQINDVLDANNAVIFVLDQHASVHAKEGIMVDFFGEPAGTYKSLAMLAKYTQVPVVPAMSYRESDGTHTLIFFPPLTWVEGQNARAEIELNTLQYNRSLEQMVLFKPEQWWWFHKRWKPLN